MGASTSSWDRRWVIPQFSIIAETYAQLTNVRVWPPHETCSNTMKTNLNVSNINDCQLVAVVLSKWLPRGLISAPRFYCLNPQHILVLNNYSWQFNKTADNQLLTAGLAKCHVDIFWYYKCVGLKLSYGVMSILKRFITIEKKPTDSFRIILNHFKI